MMYVHNFPLLLGILCTFLVKLAIHKVNNFVFLNISIHHNFPYPPPLTLVFPELRERLLFVVEKGGRRNKICDLSSGGGEGA